MAGPAPASIEEAAAALAAAERPVRFVGGGTKSSWGPPAPGVDTLSTAGLSGVVEHNAADMTAVVRAGTRLDELAAALAERGQRLALDPPGEGATLGGVIATADSGPLRHRYGGPRDLVLGATFVLAEGTVVRSGGRVIKNVAGYDLAKLFCGSFGTLGLVAEVSLRLHPLPTSPVTLVGRSDDPGPLARAAATLTHAPLEAEAIDLRWDSGAGAVLARLAGQAARRRAEAARALLGGIDAEVLEDDAALWESQRAGQRSPEGLALKVCALQTDAPRVLACARDLGGRLVGRAAHGLGYLTFDEPDPARQRSLVSEVRARLSPRPVVILDAAEAVRASEPVFAGISGGALALMGRIKQRFDPRGICSPGVLGGAA